VISQISVRKLSNVISMQAGLMGLELVHLGNIGKASLVPPFALLGAV
jgi:hypothetical protein